MLDASPEVEPIRKLVGKRLMESGRMVGAQKQLDQMLLTLWAAGYVRLEPEPPAAEDGETGRGGEGETSGRVEADRNRRMLLDVRRPPSRRSRPAPPRPHSAPCPQPLPPTRPQFAHPTDELPKLLKLRGINPLYGVYPGQPARHRQPRGADSGLRERAGNARLGGQARPRAEV